MSDEVCRSQKDVFSFIEKVDGIVGKKTKSKAEMLKAKKLLDAAKKYLAENRPPTPKPLCMYQYVQMDDRPGVKVSVDNCPLSVHAAGCWHVGEIEE
jgi:hypothetical protein